MQTADEKDKEANDVLGGTFKSRRIAKLKERVTQASGGEFTGRISPLYLQNAEKWQCTYEPVIQRACIEASANGLEIVRIDTDTGVIDGSNYALQPIAGMESIIRRVVSGDIVVENGNNQMVLRWDEYPDE